MTAPLTDRFVDFIGGIRAAAIPEHAFAIVRTGFADCVGVMIAGLDEPATVAAREVVTADGGAPQSRVALGRQRLPAPAAALVGSVAAHALDYDDWAFSCHPSAVLVPAIIAEAEAVGAGGRDMALAYIAAFEIWAKLMAREPDHYYAKGWHPTSAFGPIAVAAAAAVLRRLDARATRNALGIAASHGGGLMANFGTMTKPYHGGKSGRDGLAAARLAAAGLDANPRAIEAPDGLLAALSPKGNVDRESPPTGLGERWYIAENGLNVKRYPTVGSSQRCADAALQLHRDLRPTVEAIRRVRPRVSPKHAAVMPYHRPATALEAKFSLEFVVAAALLFGRVGLDELTDETVRRADVQALMAKVETEISADDDPEFPNGARADVVTLDLADGRSVTSAEVTRYRGHGRNPMTSDELWEKFATCTAARLDRDAARRLFDTLMRVDTLAGPAAIPTLP